jgi:hypothetical protein
MAALQNILRKALIIWLLLAVPAQVLAAVAPCEAAHHKHSQNYAQITHQQDSSHHHTGDHAAPHAKCGTGCCCMGWMTSAGIGMADIMAGTEKITLITPHFSGFISETPQHPPNSVSA